MDTIKKYYRLTKPGIIYGNALTAAGGFLYGEGRHFYPLLLLATLIGTSLVIASACVLNNYMDQEIDAFMARTKNRALVRGDISESGALIFAGLLGLVGFAILWIFTNLPTVLLGLLGFISYVGFYTPAKRHTEYSTLIGSISGATPIAAGYTAASGQIDLAAIFLFAIMAIWQMPHFYAIAMFRRDEYQAAGVPVLSVVRGLIVCKQQSLAYIALYVVAVAGFALLGYASFSFFVVMTGAALYWLWIGVRDYKNPLNPIDWSRQIFGTSLIMLLILSSLLALNPWLP